VLGDGDGAGLVWPEGEPENAAYRCEGCSRLIPHHQKAWMVERGQYRAQNPASPIPGFRVSQLISPKRSWGTIAAEFIAANESPEMLKAFINTVLAELWEERGEAPAWEAIYGRRDFYEVGVVPRGGLFLTMAVDQQRNPARLEWEVKAWGRNRECWSVEAGTIAGDPAEVRAWDELDKLIRREWAHAAGGRLVVQACAVDTGWNPQRAYEFCVRFPQPAYGPAGAAVYSHLTVVPVKGGHDWQKAIEGWSSVESARKRGGLQILTLGTSYLKLQVYNALRLVKYEDGTYPAGYWHYPNYKEWWFQGLCSEYIVEGTSGRRWKWDKRNRNEPLDLGAYNLAMAELCGIGRFTDAEWEELERRVQSRQDVQLPQASPYIPRRVIGRFQT
jgi:phage terminase large subunit GpA-like protein